MKLRNIIFMIFVFCISVSLVNAEIISNEEDKPNDSLEINNTLPDDNLQNSEVESNEKEIDNGIYIIYSKLNNLSGLHLNDNNIVLNIIKSSYNDAFRIEYKGDGNYQIKTYSNDLYLGTDDKKVISLENETYWHIKENLDGSYSFIYNDYYLDVSGGSTKDGTNIQLYKGNDTYAQKFYLTKIDFPEKLDGIYNIVTKNETLAFDFNNEVAVNSNNISLSLKNDKNSQKWNFKNITDNIYEIKSVVDSEYVVDVSSGSNSNGANIQLYKSNGTGAQRWAIIKLNDYYRFTNIISGKNIDVSGGKLLNKTNIQLYQNNNTDAQKFKLIKTEKTPYNQIINDGYFLFYSLINFSKTLRFNTNVYINDLEGTSSEIMNVEYDKNGFYYIKNGAKAFTNINGKIFMNSFNESDNQKWFIVKNNDYYTFISKVDGKVLDIPSAKVSNGNKLQTYVSNDTNAQKFYLEEVINNDLDTDYYTISSLENYIGANADIVSNGMLPVLHFTKDKNRQTWNIKKIDNNLYEIRYALNPNKVLDVANGKPFDGNKVQLYSSNNTSAQRWHIIHLKNGRYRFISNNSHTLLTINESKLKIYTFDKIKNQAFIITKTDKVTSGKTIEDGYYTIKTILDSNKVIDVKGASILDGANVQLYTSNNTLAQVFKIKYISDGLYYIYSSLNPRRALTNMNNDVKLKKFTGNNNQKWYLSILENENVSFVSYLDDKYIDVAGAKTSNGTNIQVYASNNTDAQKFILNNYGSKKTYHGIDISKWQGNINWNELIKGNPNFIIMRIGRGYSESIKDTKFEEYYKKANDYDIPVGIYIYSLANNLNEANKEAELVLKWLDNKELDLPVFYDIEYSGQLYLGKEVLTKMADTFCSKIISNNYGCGIYANVYWLNNFLDGKMLSEKYPIWLAHWTGANDYSTATLDKYKSSYVLSPYQYWQFTDKGIYHGITENTVDLDFGYDIFD